MTRVSKRTLIGLLCIISISVYADDVANQNAFRQNKGLEEIAKYFKNLGGYLGYNLEKPPSNEATDASQQLLSISMTQLAESYVFSTFLGAFPVAAFSGAAMQLLPPTASGANMVNKLANATFAYQQFENPSSNQEGKVSVNELIDQKEFQRDPVSQGVLNILGTPDSSYCMSLDLSKWDDNCQVLNQTLVMTNVLGEIPNTEKFFSYEYNKRLIGQLNANSLLGALLYSTENPNQNSTSSSPPDTKNAGLMAQNQAQEAANFVRYALGAVAPGPLPQRAAYNQLYNQAVPEEGSKVTKIQQIQAQGILANYLNNLHVFAAQSSVGASNLYYLLSKRLPQNQSGGNNTLLTSQALSEFNMATWRLFNSDMSANKQWVNQLNDATSATVAKEIATLLAEINYQMYLDRQLQERILLANSIVLIQNARSGQPSPNFNNQPSGTSDNAAQ